MPFLSSSNNAVLFNGCQSLQNLVMTLNVTQALVTVGDTGFSLQLNCYPQPGSLSQFQTLNWFQYIIYVSGGNLWWEIQYWALGASTWPSGYTPNPNTTPWLPAFPSDYHLTSFGSAPSNQIPAGSVMQIALTTDTSGNVTKASFSVTDPHGNVSSDSFSFPTGTQFPISGFQLNLVGPGGLSPSTFTSGAGNIAYNVSPGTLSVQPGPVGSSCGQYSGAITGETSNAVYGDITPASGSSVGQTLSVTAMSMNFAFDKTTFGQDEVAQSASWPSAFWLSISGFPNAQLGFNSPSALNQQPNPLPSVSATINPALNPGLTAGQIATIGANLPNVNTFGPPPVLAIDDTLSIDFQNFFYPFTILFLNQNAFNALNQQQVAVVTLSASFTVQVPTGINNNTITFTPVTVSCNANIELAKGEDPYFYNLNPADPQAYPSWLSFDLRVFQVTPNQSHQLFNVANATSAGDAIRYIQQVLDHLNNPSLITNGDTFDNTLTQDENSSALEFLPTDNSGNLVFNFAVARLRIKSSITTTINNVRVFFRLFNAASTVTDFHDVGAGEGTYRWGTNGTPGHKIPLLGVQGPLGFFGADYVTAPCFATARVNLNQPADMNTQTDPSNVASITTAPGMEVDTYFGCWLDVNQPQQTFLIPVPPLLQTQWDGPWAGTQSINGAITVAPHQCLVAEIRFDDTPIPDGANSSNSDKLAQRNIAWIDGPK